MASGEKTVMPPHRSGPASAKFSLSGSGKTHAQCAHVRGESAAMADDRRLRLRAKMVVSRHALWAVHVAAREPADAHALADRETLGIRTDGRDSTDDLVPESRGVL
jgi:hypothetical protein